MCLSNLQNDRITNLPETITCYKVVTAVTSDAWKTAGLYSPVFRSYRYCVGMNVMPEKTYFHWILNYPPSFHAFYHETDAESWKYPHPQGEVAVEVVVEIIVQKKDVVAFGKQDGRVGLAFTKFNLPQEEYEGAMAHARLRLAEILHTKTPEISTPQGQEN